MSNFNDFEFETSNISYMSLESAICNFCRIGEPDSSNLSPSISPTFIGRVRIYAQNGRVECNINITPVKPSGYNVKVTGVTVTGTRQKPYRR